MAGSSPAMANPVTNETLFLEIFVEEPCDVGEGFPRLRRGDVELILRVRLALIDIEVGGHPGAAQLAMRPHGVAQEKIARARGQDGRRKTLEVAVDRRDLGILQAGAVGVELGR